MLSAQLQHFNKYRQLQNAAKEPVEDPGDVRDEVGYRFQDALRQDNDYRDYDPLPRRILRWESGQATSATFHIGPKRQSLERIDLLYRRRYLYRIYQSAPTVDYLKAITEKDGSTTLEC